ncbi:hypothetical protein FCV25MIE_20133 [Fagus crenata]
MHGLSYISSSSSLIDSCKDQEVQFMEKDNCGSGGVAADNAASANKYSSKLQKHEHVEVVSHNNTKATFISSALDNGMKKYIGDNVSLYIPDGTLMMSKNGLV